MRALLIAIFLLAAGAGVARAAEGAPPPASCFANTGRWAYDRAKETLAAPGERFLDDITKCDSTFAASIEEAIRYTIHDEEAKKFARSQKYVFAAYGVAWGLLALSGMLVWLRQRRLHAEISTLEARLRAAEKT